MSDATLDELAERIDMLTRALLEARDYHVFCKKRMGTVTQNNVWLHKEHNDQIAAIDEVLGPEDGP